MERIRPLATASDAKAHSIKAINVQNARRRSALTSFMRMGVTPTRRLERPEWGVAAGGPMFAGSMAIALDPRGQIDACGRSAVSRWRRILRHSLAFLEWLQRAVLEMAPASLRLAIQRRRTPAAVRNDTVDPRGQPLRMASRSRSWARAHHK